MIVKQGFGLLWCGSAASLYCILRDRCKKFENRFGLSKHLKKHWVPRRHYTSSIDRKCKLALFSRCSVGLLLSRGPIRRYRSNWLETGHDCDATIDWERSRKLCNPGKLKALWRSRKKKRMRALTVETEVPPNVIKVRNYCTRFANHMGAILL